jgi:hypothetical protein
MFSDVFNMLMTRDRTVHGVLPSNMTGYTGNLAVTANASTATVATGIAMVDGKVYASNASVSLSFSGDGSWSVVLRKSWASQTVRAALVSTASVTQTDGVTWDVELARIVRTGGAIASNKDMRAYIRAPYDICQVSTIGPYDDALGYQMSKTLAGDIAITVHIPYSYIGGLVVRCMGYSGSLATGNYVIERTIYRRDPTDVTYPYYVSVMGATNKTFTYTYDCGGMDGCENPQTLFDELANIGSARNFFPGDIARIYLSRKISDGADTLASDVYLSEITATVNS